MAGLFSGLKSFFQQITKRRTMQLRFDSIKDFRGLDYETIVARIGTGAKETQLRDDGQTTRTWREANYSITLLFNCAGICLGVEEERV